MDFFGQLFAAHGEDGVTRDPADDFWYGPVGLPGAAGMPVSAETMLQASAIFSCLNVLSRPLASLPFGVFRRQADGSKLRINNHPLAHILGGQASGRHTAYEFRGQMAWDLPLWRNAYAEIIPGPRGPIDQLVRLDPANVVLRKFPAGDIAFDVVENGRMRRLREDQVWHLKAMPFTADGLLGRPVAETNRQLASAILGVQEYAARFFANDTKSGGVISIDKHFKTPEDREKYISAIRKQRAGSNRHRDLVLEFGAKYDRTAQTNDEAQFIQTKKESAVEVASIFNVPPHKIGILDKATFRNIEQQAIDFVTDSLLPHLVCWEQATARDLLPTGQNLFAEFNVLGLLRGDIKTRSQSYAIARNWGWLSVNDIRKLESMNSIGPDGDVYLQALNMAPAGAPAEPSGQGGRDASTGAKKGNGKDHAPLPDLFGGLPTGYGYEDDAPDEPEDEEPDHGETD